MTHEIRAGKDAWAELGPAEEIVDAPLAGLSGELGVLTIDGPVAPDPLAIDDLPPNTPVVGTDDDVWENAQDWTGGM